MRRNKTNKWNVDMSACGQAYFFEIFLEYLKPFIKSCSIIGDCNHGNVVMKNYKAIKNMTVHTHAYAFLCRQSGGYVIAGPSLKEHGERKTSKGE